MRKPRLKAFNRPWAFYHVISRIVDRQFIFGDDEKEQFLRFMREYEQFCGLQIVVHP